MGVSSFDQSINSTIHQAVDRTIPGFAWYNSCRTEKIVEQTVPAGGRQSGGLVNSAASTYCFST